jgi:hypothetical protein
VGEPVNLTAQVLGVRPSSQTDFTWTVSGNAIGGYVFGPQDRTASTDPVDTTNPDLKLYWIGGGTESIKADVEADGRALPVETATFNVLQPTASISTQVSPAKVQQFPVADANGQITWPSAEVGLTVAATDPPNTVEGTTFTPTVKPLAGHSGVFSWTQVATVKEWFYLPRDTGWGAPVVETGLDNDNPYPENADGTAEDVPNTKITKGSDVIGYQRDDSMVMYYMFQSSTPGSIPVPLREVHWGWHGAIIRTAVGAKWTLVDPSGPKTPPDQASTDEPTWQYVIKNRNGTSL